MDEALARDVIEKLIATKRATDREAMSMASVAAYTQQQQRQLLIGQRMDAQVDAALKVKYAECGHEGAYTPPNEGDEVGSPVFINCDIKGDEAVSKMANMATALVTGETGSEPRKPRPWWAKLLGTLLAVGLGAAIAFAAAEYFGGDANAYDMTALPYVPTPAATP